MRIGVPKEIKTNEKRVGLVADSVRELTARGHSVLVGAAALLALTFGGVDEMLTAEIGIDRYFTYIVTRPVKDATQLPIDKLLDER